MSARVITYGATLTEVLVPDHAGAVADVVLGFDTLAGYEGRHPYFGATVGRYANRIANGRFDLDGRTYTLATNNGPNHLHGGRVGFNRVVWTATASSDADAARVRLTYVSPDGEEGYPGTLTTTVTYSLSTANELRIAYEASTDKPTPVNLTNHSYWNLAGAGQVLDHELMVAAARYTPVDAGLIPTGARVPVAGTPFDFTRPKPIRADLDATGPTKGFDHNYVLDGDGLRLAARVVEPASGRTMEVLTDQPGVQVYTANTLDPALVGKHGVHYGPYGALCLETQHFPDSPNQATFPSTVLRPGRTFTSTTIYRFSSR